MEMGNKKPSPIKGGAEFLTMDEAVYLFSAIFADESLDFPNDRVTRNYLG